MRSSAVTPNDPDTPLTGTTISASTDGGSRVTRQSNLTSNTGGRARQSWRNSISSAVGSLRRSNTTTNPARLGPISAPIRRQSDGTTNESPTDPALIPSGLGRIVPPISPASKITTNSARSGPILAPTRYQSAGTTNESPTDPALNPGGSGRTVPPISSGSNTTTNPARLGSISAPIRRESAGTTNESPTDPALIPSRTVLPISPVAADAPITKPDEPRSFLDLDSDDSSDDDRPYSRPVVSRASSVRVQRPTLVQTHSSDKSSTTASGVTIQVYNGDLLSPRPAVNVPRPLSTHAEDAEEPKDMPKVAASESTNPSTRGMGPNHAYQALTANAPSPQFVSRFSESTDESALPTGVDTPLPTPKTEAETVNSTTGLGPEVALKALTGEDDNASTTALAPTPKSQNTSTPVLASSPEVPDIEAPVIKQTIIEIPETTTEQSTLPSPFGGFGAIGPAIRFSPLDSNPVDTNAARLHRTISAPMPHQNPNRKVTIRPSDLVISDAHGDHKLFRDHVVSTPYPARKDSVANMEEAIAMKKLPALVEEKDRFPSQDRAEVLVLQLAAARHAGMKKTIAVEVADKGTFDDAQLFKAIQKAYSKDLLGPARRIFGARHLSHATFSNDVSFDAEDFIKHLKGPQTGHKRKGWLLWLRQHQPFFADSPQDRKRDSYASYYSPSSVPRMPFQRSLLQPPKVVLHFEFSIVAIALAVLVCILLSCLATMFWVLFGTAGSMDISQRDWRQDAEGRVLTGLVLGIFVLSLSSLGSAVWIGGSYVLL